MKRLLASIAIALVAALVPSQGALAEDVHEIPLAMIVVGFDGGDDPAQAVPYDEGYDWSAALFGEGESPASYYRDMSEGSFAFVPASETSEAGVDDNANALDRANDGIVHVTLHRPHGAWGAVNVEHTVTENFARMAMQAIEAAAPYIDFASYDANENGSLSQKELVICLCIAGYEASPISDYGRDDVPLMWAHSGIFGFLDSDEHTIDGLRFGAYIAISEHYWEEADPTDVFEQEPLGVVYHELGHALGLPDLYAVTHTEGPWSEYEVGPLSLMDAGGWQYSDDGAGWRNIPTALDGWSRYALGWATPTLVAHSGDYTVTSQLSDAGYGVLVIPTDDADEYFVVENRQAEGHDLSLAPDYLDTGGIIVWHVDNAMYSRYYNANEVNDADHHPAVMADNLAGQTAVELMRYGEGDDTPDEQVPAGITLRFDPAPGRDAIVHVEMDDMVAPLNALHLLDDSPRADLRLADENLLEAITAIVNAATR